MTDAPTADYQVFVMSCNRPQMLAGMLRSILAAGCPASRITVSDNSTDEAIRAVVAEFPGAIFLFRRPQLPLLDHFNTVIRSATAGYFFILHDDDLVLPNFFADSLALIARHPAVGAATLNALFLDGDRPSRELCCPADFDERLLADGAAFLRAFFSLRQTYFPFPNYVYRTARVAAIDARMEGAGKCSDVVLLAQLAARWGIVQSTRPGMLYRRHAAQGSATVSINRNKEILTWAHRHGIDLLGDADARLARLRFAWWLARARGWRRTMRRLGWRFAALLLRHPARYPYAAKSIAEKIGRRLRRPAAR